MACGGLSVDELANISEDMFKILLRRLKLSFSVKEIWDHPLKLQIRMYVSIGKTHCVPQNTALCTVLIRIYF